MTISGESTIEEILRECPDSFNVFEKYNIQVFICGEPVWDDLNSICEKHSIDKNKLIEEIKTTCSKL